MTTLPTEPEVRTVSASEFRAQCLGLLDEVAETGVEIVITERGEPVARLSPYRGKPEGIIGRYQDLITIHGDLDEPIDEDWEAEFDKKWDERLAPPPQKFD